MMGRVWGGVPLRRWPALVARACSRSVVLGCSFDVVLFLGLLVFVSDKLCTVSILCALSSMRSDTKLSQGSASKDTVGVLVGLCT